tara:strand:+ start:54 stop:758 length:705 start_codon:yes stop_codon:yes gene_type:complete
MRQRGGGKDCAPAAQRLSRSAMLTDRDMSMPSILAKAATFALITLLAACGAADKDLADPATPIGEFKLGHNIVVAKNAQMVPPSRRASAEEWQTAIGAAVDERFSRYDGDQMYHIAISVDGYSIAVPGVPIVLSPKSVLVVSANIWDDAAGKRLNDEPHRLTVLERLSGETVVGSGLTQSREQQIENLAKNTARLVENWMRQNPEWFARKPGDPNLRPENVTVQLPAGKVASGS